MFDCSLFAWVLLCLCGFDLYIAVVWFCDPYCFDEFALCRSVCFVLIVDFALDFVCVVLVCDLWFCGLFGLLVFRYLLCG